MYADTMDHAAPSLDTVFAAADFTVRGIYEHLITAMRPFGDVEERPAHDSMKLANGSGVLFAGAHPEAEGLLVSIRAAVAIPSGRMRKIQQVEPDLFDNELLLCVPNEIDAELVGWLRDAYDLAALRNTD